MLILCDFDVKKHLIEKRASNDDKFGLFVAIFGKKINDSEKNGIFFP